MLHKGFGGTKNVSHPEASNPLMVGEKGQIKGIKRMPRSNIQDVPKMTGAFKKIK